MTVTSDFSKIFEGSQAYTVLSRTKRLDQLFLLNDVYEHKIYASQKAIDALKSLEERAVNPNCIGRRDDQIKIASLNVQSIIHHIEDLKAHHKILEHNIVFCNETWLNNEITNRFFDDYQIPNYAAHFVNAGNGKGLAAYSEQIFQYDHDIYDDTFQMMKYSASFVHDDIGNVEVDIISIYRSSNCAHDGVIIENIRRMFRNDRICIIYGDLNLRYQNQPKAYLIQEILNLNFSQLINHPTHRDGGIIDHVYLFRPHMYEEVVINWELFAPFYSDHFGISIIIQKRYGLDEK